MLRCSLDTLTAATGIARTMMADAAQALREAATLVALADPDGWASPAATQYEIWSKDLLGRCNVGAAAAETAETGLARWGAALTAEG
ncbi:MAG: hypothetical protein LBL01_07965 [Bifidobacteriaceae bacterium]|nr:hypothetical protein [Bifidobacteriaceae bacterium]